MYSYPFFEVFVEECDLSVVLLCRRFKISAVLFSYQTLMLIRTLLPNCGDKMSQRPLFDSGFDPTPPHTVFSYLHRKVTIIQIFCIALPTSQCSQTCAFSSTLLLTWTNFFPGIRTVFLDGYGFKILVIMWFKIVRGVDYWFVSGSRIQIPACTMFTPDSNNNNSALQHTTTRLQPLY